MCRIAILFLLQRLKGSMSGDARGFNNIETRAVIKFFFSARQGAKENSRHSYRTVMSRKAVVNGKLLGWVGIGSTSGERNHKAVCSRD
jgi:hypothetical protein